MSPRARPNKQAAQNLRYSVSAGASNGPPRFFFARVGCARSCGYHQTMNCRLHHSFLILAGIALVSAVRGDRPAPQRIVILAPSTAEIVCELGACDRIIGAGKFCNHPPELKTRRPVGGLYDPDIEAIIALQPDLLITRGKHDALERLGETLQLRVYHDETDSLEGIERTIIELGGLLQLTERAGTLAAEFRDSIARLRADHVQREPVRVLLTVARNPERLSNILTAGRGTFLSQMIEVTGGRNVFGDLDMRYPEVSLESIIAKQPEVIIELMPDVDASSHDSLRRQWREYAMIPAVRDNRIHILSDDNVLIPAPRFLRVIEKVGRLIHMHGEAP